MEGPAAWQTAGQAEAGLQIGAWVPGAPPHGLQQLPTEATECSHPKPQPLWVGADKETEALRGQASTEATGWNLQPGTTLPSFLLSTPSVLGWL